MPGKGPTRKAQIVNCMASKERTNSARGSAGAEYCYWLPTDDVDKYQQDKKRLIELRSFMKDGNFPAAPTATELFLALPPDDEVKRHLSTEHGTISFRGSTDTYTIKMHPQRVEVQGKHRACWIHAISCNCPAFLSFGNYTNTRRLATGKDFVFADGTRGSTSLARKKDTALVGKVVQTHRAPARTGAARSVKTRRVEQKHARP